ncbi:glycosyltransferase family 4 protein [Thalassobaculum sp.]|uniref:glycosyltransferase family 4 protein n=1 Tax=Thalassobaculum sp. TaxID=2022740 RepID=UPI0032EC540B
MTRAAILYDSRGFDAGRERLTGLAMASAGFLRAYLDHAQPGPLWLHPTDESTDAEAFRGRFPTDRRIEVVHRLQTRRLAEPGALFVPGPVLAPFAWRRRVVGDAAYSLTGVTHTMSSVRALDAVRDLLVAPTRPWDALICASRAIRDLVEGVLDRHAEHLAERTGGVPMGIPLQLPVIPLGIDLPRIRGEDRARFRAEHGLSDDAVAVLYLGRLSAHAKAHPLPMFRALGRAASRTTRPIVAVLAGWYHDDETRTAFEATAAALAPTVRVIAVDARPPAVKRGALAGADVFLSLSDNLQESFGLTPVEAMAAGLPCVVSDWDGYRDTVVDGETGFRVPTALPPPGIGAELAWRRLLGIDDESVFHALTSEAVAVDTEAAAEALARLADDPALRRRMGAAGQARTLATYVWPRVIGAYEALWAELMERRAAAGPTAGAEPSIAPDPFAAFAGFATPGRTGEMRIRATDGLDPVVELARIAALPKAVIDPRLPGDAAALLERLGQQGSLTLSGDQISAQPGAHRALLRAAFWLAHAGIVRITFH